MTRMILLTLALATVPLAARADVTVVYAPAAPRAPLVARPVGPTEPVDPRADGRDRSRRADSPTVSAAPVIASPGSAPAVPAIVPEPAALNAPCPSPRPVTLVREGTGERAQLALTDCGGRAEPASLTELSVLARPRTLTTRPSARELAEHATDDAWVAAGVRRLHPGLAERLRALADRFPGHEIEIVSGFRPDAREGSRHLFGIAIDVRVRGASLDAVHAFVRRFDRTGVGLVRAAGLVHLDVRPRSVHWIDEGAPGEPARIEPDEAPRGGALVRAPEPATAAPPSTARATPEPSDDAAIDADAVADEVLRGLGDLPLPSGPSR